MSLMNDLLNQKLQEHKEDLDPRQNAKLRQTIKVLEAQIKELQEQTEARGSGPDDSQGMSVSVGSTYPSTGPYPQSGQGYMVSAQNDPRPVVTSPVPRPRAERQGDIDYQNDSQTQGLKKAWEAMYRYWPNWKSS